MIVVTHELGNLAQGGFAKSKLAEEALLKLISKKRGVSYSVDLTEGKNTDWDGTLGRSHVEVKFSAKVYKGDNRLSNYFETNYKSGAPSALLLSKADKYITVTPGWSNKYSMLTGKVRMWNRADLLNVMHQFPIVKDDYGASGFYIPNKSSIITHDWVGDVFFDQQQYSYDLSKWI